MKSLAEWLRYLGRLHPSEIDLGLDRVRAVANRLGLLPVPYKVITVGGTNGKGTTCHLLEGMYRHAGYKTGLGTSPHLLEFNERIVINGVIIDDQSIVKAFARIEAGRAEISLTYFEFSLLATLIIFKEARIDIAILEVGLGGRLDAVNIIDADVAAITTIDFDHMNYLGNTRELIGFEKAGIFRAGKSAVCGDARVPLSIQNHAESIKAPLLCQSRDFHFHKKNCTWDWESDMQSLKGLPMPAIPLQNAATALMIVECMNAYMPVKREAIDYALENVRVTGRFQVFKRDCLIIVDVAHNPESARLLAENLQAMSCQGKTLAVFSALGDKDISGIVDPLKSNIDTWYYATLDTDRAATKDQLTACLHPYKHQNYATIDLAFKAALKAATAEDRIVVFGSFYVVAVVLPQLTQE
ncbi:MAG: bifunctional tetrahydrofolate synthase/dihydrofolate synthase [Gammaproteobacteria bacterium]|nr:bifunctional tetrahydrofolate synthase/dihydrofolate synthase [Gammaproteobacteria bacterium]